MQAAFGKGWIVTATYPLLALALGTLSTMTTAFVVERRERRRVDEHNDVLEERVRERTAQLRETQLEIVQRLSQAAESRDGDTGEHIQRIRRMTHKLALAIGVPEDEAELIGHASAMHDVGKIGIPDRVLLKPGKLDAEEWALMQSHTTIGAEILAGSNSALLQIAEEIALTHHERYDGTGYPQGLRRRGDPARRAHHRDLRRLRRPALAARLQGPLDDRRRRRRAAGAARAPLRPRARRRLPRPRARPRAGPPAAGVSRRPGR